MDPVCTSTIAAPFVVTIWVVKGLGTLVSQTTFVVPLPVQSATALRARQKLITEINTEQKRNSLMLNLRLNTVNGHFKCKLTIFKFITSLFMQVLYHFVSILIFSTDRLDSDLFTLEGITLCLLITARAYKLKQIKEELKN